MLTKVDNTKIGTTYNLRLRPEATDEDKYKFERYIMWEMCGQNFLPEMFPEMKDPYYTWEDKVVKRNSLKGARSRL